MGRRGGKGAGGRRRFGTTAQKGRGRLERRNRAGAAYFRDEVEPRSRRRVGQDHVSRGVGEGEGAQRVARIAVQHVNLVVAGAGHEKGSVGGQGGAEMAPDVQRTQTWSPEKRS